MSRVCVQIAVLLLACGTNTAAGISLEEAIAEAASQVRKNYGNWMMVEAMACKLEICPPEKGLPASMYTPSDAGFMRAVFMPFDATFPNVAVFINLTAAPVTMTFEYHTDPFVQDNTTAGFPPPATNLTFEAAWTLMHAAAPKSFGVTQVTWRRPVHPCCSEDLFQFNLDDAVPDHGAVVSVGTVSKKTCYGFVTNQVDVPFCKKTPGLKPDCVSPNAAGQDMTMV